MLQKYKLDEKGYEAEADFCVQLQQCAYHTNINELSLWATQLKSTHLWLQVFSFTV